MIPSTRSTYQEGSYERVRRAKGAAVWVYRWREKQADGKNVQRRKLIGTVDQFPTLTDAKRATENLRAEINASRAQVGKLTVRDAWGHFQENELRDPGVDRSPTTIQAYLDYFKSRIIPEWGNVFLDEVKSVAVERWLRSLDLAAGTKAKIRNLMSALFSHCIRWELFTKLNPIASVRQGAVREKDPDVLTLDELKAVMSNIENPAVRVMVAVAGCTAVRRSEMRGLKWADLNFDKLWINLKRGVVHKHVTKMKTKASRKGVPMLPELADVLEHWRKETPYPAEADWVFASPYTKGERPFWPEAALENHIRPAAKKAGITKQIGWHTFRHSFGTLLGNGGEDLKTVQELLRHANSRITADVYQQGDTTKKRNALTAMSGMFMVPPVTKAG